MNNPFERMPEVPSFAIKSDDVAEGDEFAKPQWSAMFGVPGGQDTSPQLSWSGAPDNAKSYAIQMYDPDAPTMSGFWHWSVANVPVSFTSLPSGAGDDTGSGLPLGAVQLRNDAGSKRFIGAAPPQGHGKHRYFIVVSALSVETLEGLNADWSPAVLGFNLFSNVVGRAVLMATAEAK